MLGESWAVYRLGVRIGIDADLSLASLHDDVSVALELGLWDGEPPSSMKTRLFADAPWVFLTVASCEFADGALAV